jgi:hypothetical protein
MKAARTKKPKPPAKFAATSMRLDPVIKAALEEAAKKERRTMTSLTQVILEGWLQERGFMK